jgi:hypothetical protein
MTRYQVPVADELLEQRPWLPVEGFRLVSADGPYNDDPDVTLCTFDDDNAPADLEGCIVEPVFRRTGGRMSEDEPVQPFRTVIMSRSVLKRPGTEGATS